MNKEKSRRDFLKKSWKAPVLVAMGGLGQFAYAKGGKKKGKGKWGSF